LLNQTAVLLKLLEMTEVARALRADRRILKLPLLKKERLELLKVSQVLKDIRWERC
jgi:hypothetical protein